jgi:hypothetical protein
MKLKISFSNGAGGSYVAYEASNQGYSEIETLADSEQNVIAKIFVNPDNLLQSDFSSLQEYLIPLCPENSLTFEVVE